MADGADDDRVDDHGYALAHDGAYGRVLFAVMSDGVAPAKVFWDSLTTQQQAGFGTLFRKIMSNPQRRLTNRQQFKQVDGDLFEFKKNNYQMRIFCFRDGDNWYLTSGLDGKKENDLPPGEVKRAIEFMEDAKSVLAKKK